MRHRPAPFDSQAETYDRRVGWPEKDCREIVRAVLEMAEAQPGDLIVEMGAGTGMIGRWFAQPPWRYTGIDLSRGMLDRFRRRLPPHGDAGLLLQADGNRLWPLAAAATRVIFGSRALHLLDPEHVIHEIWRVARPDGAVLIIGRVHRRHDSVPAMMRHEMRRRLCQHGFHARQGDRHPHQLIDLSCQRGAKVIEPVVAARRMVARTPGQALANWHQKPGLGGLNPPDCVKRVILEALGIWAQTTFGGLHQPVESEEAYVLQGARLRPNHRS